MKDGFLSRMCYSHFIKRKGSKNMNLLLLTLLCVTEIAFAVMAITRKPNLRDWQMGRLIVNGGELLVFLLTLLLPGIDLGMRFTCLFYMLLIRILFSGVGYLIRRKKTEKAQKTVFMILGALLSMVLIFLSMIPSFVFTDYQGLPVTGEYTVAQVKAILIDESRVEEQETDGSCREVPVYFFYPEDAESGETFPVVFFSHGAFGYYQSNMSTYMELASHGYVVVSMEHPYHSVFTSDTSGNTIIVSPEFMQEIQNVNRPEATKQEIFEAGQKWIQLRSLDANFAIDAVQFAAGEAAEKKPLPENWFVEEQDREILSGVLADMDLEKIGFMGHSMGGATAVSMGRTRDDIDAVVDLDGTMLGEVLGVEDDQDIINEEIYPVPLLSFDNQEHHDDRMRCVQEGIPYANNVVLENAEEGFSTYIAQSGHMNYTDLPMFSPALGSMLGVGEVDTQDCMVKVNEIVLRFFDCYLKDLDEFQVEEGYQL